MKVSRLTVKSLLADGAPERTVFHSYSGDAEMGEIARENGWYLSLSGTSSYKGNGVADEDLGMVPIYIGAEAVGSSTGQENTTLSNAGTI